jgi:hypothetical protein
VGARRGSRLALVAQDAAVLPGEDSGVGVIQTQPVRAGCRLGAARHEVEWVPRSVK